MKPLIKTFLAASCTLCMAELSAQQSIRIIPENLPRIPSLSSSDIVFSQYCADVEDNYRRIAAGKELNAQFYTYTAVKGDTLFTINAACSLPYETIATINRITWADESLEGRTLILPAAAGLFICETPESSIEILLQREFRSAIEQNAKTWYTVGRRKYFFLLNGRFSSTERAFFLDASLRMPLDHSWLSSKYGMRISPISGNWKFHKGIDLAAPEGTPVYACKGGRAVSCIHGDPVFGNCIILLHDGGMTSVYAHLSKILIEKGDIVQTGKEIGLVGQTGAATGPHLHFEIRINGVSTDPQKLLPD